MEKNNCEVVLNTENQEINSTSTELKFYMKDAYLFEIESETIEPLSQETFSSLIEHFASMGKTLLIAVIKNRDLDDPSHLFSFYFNAFQINKLVFKKRHNGEIISRHDKNFPLAVSNPLTNLPIIGEIEYYQVKTDKNAYFIGTDYTFTQDEKLRSIFIENALRTEDCELREFNSSIDDIHRFTNLNTSSIGLLEQVLEDYRNSLLSQIRVPFKKAVVFGIIILSYFIILDMTIFNSAKMVKII
jgi:hypothetical protein